MGRKVVALNVLRADDVLGVNTRQHLAQAGAIMQGRIQDHWMTEGVSIVDPRNTYIDGRASIGRDTVIYPFTVIAGAVKIGSHCRDRAAGSPARWDRARRRRRGGAFRRDQAIAPGPAARWCGTWLTWVMPRSASGSTSARRPSPPTSTASARARRGSATGTQIGAGAILVAPVSIGDDAVVGANAVVTRDHDVADGQTVVGVPARPIERKRD